MSKETGIISTKSSFTLNDKTYYYYAIKQDELSANKPANRLPVSIKILGYTDLMVDGAPSPHQSDTTLRWLIDRLRS